MIWIVAPPLVPFQAVRTWLIGIRSRIRSGGKHRADAQRGAHAGRLADTPSSIEKRDALSAETELRYLIERNSPARDGDEVVKEAERGLSNLEFRICNMHLLKCRTTGLLAVDHRRVVFQRGVGVMAKSLAMLRSGT